MPQVHEAVKTSCPEINQQPLQHFKWNSTLYMCFRNVTVCRAGRREGRSCDWKQGCLGRRISHLIVTSCLASKAPSNCGTQSCLVLGTRLVRKTMFNSWNLTLAINFQKKIPTIFGVLSNQQRHHSLLQPQFLFFLKPVFSACLVILRATFNLIHKLLVFASGS